MYICEYTNKCAALKFEYCAYIIRHTIGVFHSYDLPRLTCTWVGKLFSRHFWRLHLLRKLCLKIMLESCARQFSIRTIAPTRNGYTDQLNFTSGENLWRTSTPSIPTNVFIRGNMLERTHTACTLFHDEARRLREPLSTVSRLFPSTRFIRRGKLSFIGRFMNTSATP